MNNMVYVLGGILVVVLVLGLLMVINYLKTKNKDQALAFLYKFYSVLTANAIELVKSHPEMFAKLDVDQITESFAEMIYDSSWEFIEEKKKEENDELTDTVLHILNREFVDAFVKTIIDTLVKSEINHTFMMLNKGEDISEDFVARVEREDKELQEKFSDDTLYVEDLNEVTIENEEVKPSDLEPEADFQEIPVEEDEGIEIIGEDGLTESEREAGVHFDKNGRKRNKHGRYVK